MKLRIAFLSFSLLLIGQLFAAQSVRLAWDANTESDLAGYVVHYGTASRSYTNSSDVGLVTTTTVSNLLEGVTYYFAVTAYNTSGLESEYSNEVSFTGKIKADIEPVEGNIWGPGQQSKVLQGMNNDIYAWGKKKPSSIPSIWSAPWMVERPDQKPIYGGKREIIAEAKQCGATRIYNRAKKCWVPLSVKVKST
jgi:hypothetical protein